MVSSSRLQKPPRGLFTVHQGDARNLEHLLGRYSSPSHPLLTATITSPPYGDLKDYGHRDQIGFGQPYEEYLVELRRVFRTVYTHTRDDGCLWVIADSVRPGDDGLRRLEPLPFQLAQQLQEVGWMLREVIIWKKNKTLPWSGRGRLRNAFEYVLFFVKSANYKFEVDRIRDPDELTQWWVKWPERYNPAGKAPDNVWKFDIPLQGSWGTTTIQHACPLPPDLVRRLVLLSTDPGDVVLDPFAGSGVVVAEAERLERKAIGVELVKKHINSYVRVVKPEILARTSGESGRDSDSPTDLTAKILNLRALKYPKVLLQGLRRSHSTLPSPAMVIALVEDVSLSSADPTILVNAQVIFVFDSLNGEIGAIEEALKKLANRQPASKFGVGATFTVTTRSGAAELVGDTPLFLYTGGRTHMSSGPIEAARLESLVEEPNRANYPPIVANVEVSERPQARTVLAG
jgi:DNA modification methylase